VVCSINAGNRQYPQNRGPKNAQHNPVALSSRSVFGTGGSMAAAGALEMLRALARAPICLSAPTRTPIEAALLARPKSTWSAAGCPP
jgi:hypothetical protein